MNWKLQAIWAVTFEGSSDPTQEVIGNSKSKSTTLFKHVDLISVPRLPAVCFGHAVAESSVMPFVVRPLGRPASSYPSYPPSNAPPLFTLFRYLSVT